MKLVRVCMFEVLSPLKHFVSIFLDWFSCSSTEAVIIGQLYSF